MVRTISEETIRERAYLIWQREGCPHGRHRDHWLLAIRELASELDAGKTTIGAKNATPPRTTSARRRTPRPAATGRTSKTLPGPR